jgi:hypothetical protein
MDNAPSAPTQVAALDVGEIYTLVRFIPSNTPNLANAIKEARKSLTQQLSSVMARARAKEPDSFYVSHTVHSFTRSYDVVVTGVVVRELGL